MSTALRGRTACLRAGRSPCFNAAIAVPGPLAVTTGWIRRDKVQRLGVSILTGVDTRRIDSAGVHHTARDGKAATLPFDSVILCVGQEPVRELAEGLHSAAPTLPVHVIGGADRAAELDAKRAIEQAYRLALASDQVA